jgi:hypothetical protein
LKNKEAATVKYSYQYITGNLSGITHTMFKQFTGGFKLSVIFNSI